MCIRDSLRTLPTLPADPRCPREEYVDALDTDHAISLPTAHCAFQGCTSCGDDDVWLMKHLYEQHLDAFEKSDDCKRKETIEEDLNLKTPQEDEIFSMYSEAVARVIRNGAPLATHSIDRRCLKQYTDA